MRMQFSPDLGETLSRQVLPRGVLVGFDLVQVSGITQSVDTFGPAFTERFFTAGEIAHAARGSVRDERLAARFAAKEAAIKALRMSETGLDWRDIEVVQLAGGGCELVLHGKARQCAEAAGVTSLALSLSHDGDYAGAVVTALTANINREIGSDLTSD